MFASALLWSSVLILGLLDGGCYCVPFLATANGMGAAIET